MSRPRTASVSSIGSSRSPEPAPQRSTSESVPIARCKWCSVLKPDDWHHCPMAPHLCGLVDTETGEECTVRALGQTSIEEHRLKCEFLQVPCKNYPDCPLSISQRSTALHLASCPFEVVTCAECRTQYTRNLESDHTVRCPEAIVPCPLGCGEHMKRHTLPEHITRTAEKHTPRHIPNADDVHCFPFDSPETVISLLLMVVKSRAMEEHIEPQSARQLPVAAPPVESTQLPSSFSTYAEGTSFLSQLRPPASVKEGEALLEQLTQLRKDLHYRTQQEASEMDRSDFERVWFDVQCKLYDACQTA